MTRPSIPLRPLPSQPQRSGFFKVSKFSSFSHFQVRSLLAAHTHREMVKDSQVSDCKWIYVKTMGLWSWELNIQLVPNIWGTSICLNSLSATTSVQLVPEPRETENNQKICPNLLGQGHCGRRTRDEKITIVLKGSLGSKSSPVCFSSPTIFTRWLKLTFTLFLWCFYILWD